LVGLALGLSAGVAVSVLVWDGDSVAVENAVVGAGVAVALLPTTGLKVVVAEKTSLGVGLGLESKEVGLGVGDGEVIRGVAVAMGVRW
jgi:hypothetical protein